jgi:hypothetical protein
MVGNGQVLVILETTPEVCQLYGGTRSLEAPVFSGMKLVLAWIHQNAVAVGKSLVVVRFVWLDRKSVV